MWFRLIALMVFAIHQSYEAGVTLDSLKVPCACGSVNRRTRVVGGEETLVGEYPFMAIIKQGIQISSPSGSSMEIIDLCGAALVSKDYAVTACHCFVRINDIRQLLVYFGDHDSTKSTEIPSVIRSVILVTKHPNYNTTTQANDIAIVKLNASVTYQWNIQPICIPPAGLKLFEQSVIVLGWGATEAAGASSPVLREVTIPVIPNTECKKLYTGTVAVIDDSTVCAGTPDGSKDACQGDSGGPAAWKCDDDSDYSLGCVVSYGIGCGNPRYPGVFTNVSNYLSWIIQNTPGNALCGSQCYPTPTTTDCGWANVIPPRRKRIVGGSDTTANKYPWVVSIYIFKNSAWTFTCAGSIISSTWVLTSGKCVYNVALSDIFLVVGDYNVNILNEPGEKEVFPARIVVHPNYTSSSLENDIALIELTDRLEFNVYVGPVCLPSITAVVPTTAYVPVVLVGWGRIATDGGFASKLKEVTLKTITNNECKLRHGSIIKPSMICTNSTKTEDACDGDLGGPLMLQGQSKRYYAVALQSFRYGPRCASEIPSGNTRTTSFLSWIESVSGVRPASTSDTFILPA